MPQTTVLVGGPFDGVELAAPFPAKEIRHPNRQPYDAEGRYVLVLEDSHADRLLYRWRAWDE